MTLHPSGLDAACGRLAVMVRPFAPAVVVGILTGGGEVGRRLVAMLPDAAYAEVGLHRSGTPRKKRARRLLRSLPTFAADLLRRAESLCCGYRRPVRRRAATLPAPLRALLHAEPQPKVLIVDDAVDSGATLQSVVEAVRREAPCAEVRAAVLTVTRRNPLITPDYTLWNDRTLLRFPWSNDYNPCRP